MKPDATKWVLVRANNEDANMAESVMNAADRYLDGFGVTVLSFSYYRNRKGCTQFADQAFKPSRVVTVRWHTCCEQHPIVVESVEFATC